MRTMPVAVVLFAAFFTVGCKMKIDNKKLEDGITEQLKKVGATVKSVSCPADVEAKAGNEFKCKVKLENEEFDVVVTQKDDKGNVEWKVPDPKGAASAAPSGEPTAAPAEE